MYTNITEVKKRSGDVVPFDPAKIQHAILKAYLQTRGQQNPELAHTLTEGVVAELGRLFADKIPSVEDVQNIVEMHLMAENLFDVAKEYIIYRYQHTKIREAKQEEVQRKIEEQGVMVVKRSGVREVYSEAKVRASLEKILGSYAGVVAVDKVLQQLRLEIYEEIPTKEIARTLIMVLRSYIEKDPGYSFVAAQALLNEIYKDVIGHDRIDFSNLETQLREAFVRNVQYGVSIGRLDPKILLFDLGRMAGELSMTRDSILNYLSVQTLQDRYLVKDPETKQLLETPQMFWMRIAMGVALEEKEREARALEFYSIISTLHFVPSSPTLFHAGTVHPQLSSCYLTTVEDDLHHIFKCLGDNAQLSKWAGGVANDWNNLRGTGALIKRTGVESQGVIPFLKIANDTTVAINRSGRRRGATCAYLETWHYDIESFLELRKNTGDERRRTHDMNIANWIPDLFMKRVKEDGMWSLFSPDEVPDLHHIFGKQFEKRFVQYEAKGKAGELRLFKQMRARDLWRKMLTMLFETGHPWVTFKDPSNIRSPQDHVGVVHSSNLCTEITLNTSAEETAVCNLGSVNLARHITNGVLDMQKLAFTVTIGMRMLDNVIDINFYPTDEAKASNMKHRPVGLGVMGFHDALYQMNIPFDSETMIDFADKSMEAISYHAILASANMARERGVYASYRGSKWGRGIFPVDTIALLEAERGATIPVPRTESMDWSVVRNAVAEHGMRNSNCMAIAPTATISNISGAIPSIEPIYNNIYVKANISGDFVVVNTYLVEDLKRIGLWNDNILDQIKYNDGKLENIPGIPQELKDKYKQVFEIDAKWLIRAAAYRGKWIDQSQSLNIFYSGNSGKEINDIYLYAYDMGIKTTYYLRTLAVSQVEKSTVDTAAHGKTHTRGAVGVATSMEETMHAAETPAPTPVPEPVAAAVVEESRAVEIKAEPVAPTTGVLATAAATFKICRLDDPSCEACQ